MTKNEKLKIFVDAHGFDKEFQGSRTFIKEIYAQLSKKNDIQLYVGAYDTQNLVSNFSGMSNIIFIKYKSRTAFTRLFFELPSLIRKYGIDYAHFQYFVPVFKNCRFIVTIHDVLFLDYKKEFSFMYRKVRQLFCKRAAHQADLLTTVSSFSKIAIEKNFKIPPPGIHIIQNGVHPRYFQPYEKQAMLNFLKVNYGLEKFILCVSRLEPRKNHELLLSVYLELELYADGFQLVLLGHESVKTPEFDKLMKSMPATIRSMVFLHGKINEEELQIFYRAAAVFVYPSKAEGFGIPPLEAAAVKTPVLCSNTTAMSTYVFFGENHVDPTDRELFKVRLSAIVHTPPDNAELNRISEKIRKEYNWEQQAEKLYRLIIDDSEKLEDKNKSKV